MHRHYCRLTEQPPVDMKETYRWLKAANLPAATEGLVVAAQDQAFQTLYYECKILHCDVSPICRMCSVGLETVDHIVTGCSALALMDYTDRHNHVASIIHWRSKPIVLTSVSEIRRQTLVFLLISAVLLMATLTRNMRRSWRSTATCEWR